MKPDYFSPFKWQVCYELYKHYRWSLQVVSQILLSLLCDECGDRGADLHRWHGHEWQGSGLSPGLTLKPLPGVKGVQMTPRDHCCINHAVWGSFPAGPRLCSAVFLKRGSRSHHRLVMVDMREGNYSSTWECSRLPQRKSLSSLTTIVIV